MKRNKGKTVKEEAPIIVISSLEFDDPTPLAKKKRYDTVEEAVEKCKAVIATRGRQNHDPITLCVLKVVSTIHFAPTPLEVKKYK